MLVGNPTKAGIMRGPQLGEHPLGNSALSKFSRKKKLSSYLAIPIIIFSSVKVLAFPSAFQSVQYV